MTYKPRALTRSPSLGYMTVRINSMYPCCDLLTKDGDVIEIKDKPLFHKSKQQELYHFIRQRVEHTATLADLKAATIANSDTCGKDAFDHLVGLKARSESDIVESNRRKLRKLRVSWCSHSRAPGRSCTCKAEASVLLPHAEPLHLVTQRLLPART